MDILNFAQRFAEEGLAMRRGREFQGDPAAFTEKAEQAVPGEVRMISGCQDAQTSADVSNVAAFGLPPDAGPGGAGGACTNALLATLEKDPNPTWIGLLHGMRAILSQRGYAQIPEMSSSRPLSLTAPFEVQSEAGGAKKALLVGINYVGQQGALKGCVNDAKSVKLMLQERGFQDFRVLADDGEGFGEAAPTKANILQGFTWLVEGAKAGDSLFFHYSGHGGNQHDTSGDEKDGKDETLIPVDYASAGQITDDVILQKLVLPVPAGCQLTALMDCCHSGTVFDLPYTFKADDQALASAEETIASGGDATVPINANFDLGFVLALSVQMLQAFQTGGLQGALQAGLMGFFNR